MSPAADPRLQQICREHARPVLFAALSGAHLYGFPSPDSDFDLRGVHVLALDEVVGLRQGPATLERLDDVAGMELDLVTHDIAKFMGLMLKPNGYVLEQLFSPLVVVTTPEHRELQDLGRRCVTRWHERHYRGFADTQWRLFQKERPARIKPLLYVYRVLLTGIHLMRSGEVEADLRVLNADARLPQVDDLIARKVGSREQVTLADGDLAIHEREYQRLLRELGAAAASTGLPPKPSARDGLHDLLVRIRTGGLGRPSPA